MKTKRTPPLAIDADRIRDAARLLEKYRAGKANLEARVIENESWYKMRRPRVGKENTPSLASGWLFNAIANKHADAMDNLPSPVILPREEDDRAEAETLSAVVPVILDRCDFEQVFSDVQLYKLKTGTGVYGVFWDGTLLGGRGDVSLKRADLLSLFWEPGVSDIQDSPRRTFPVLEGKLPDRSVTVASYPYDDAVDLSDKSLVVDWYYKKKIGSRTVVHLCKFTGDVCLFSSEDEPLTASRGFYDHGMYPFVFDTLYTVEGSPAGFGFIDVGKDAQSFIDRGGQAIFENLLAGARPRYFERIDGSINPEEFEDFTKTVVHVAGNLGEDSIRPVGHYPLSPVYLEVMREKIGELKEVVGNRDVSSGGTSSGVTAASAIAAMQEAGAKLTRDGSRAAYRAFRRVVLMIIELIRQFYDTERTFRIVGADGAEKFIGYENGRLAPRDLGEEFGEPLGVRVPLFDVKVAAEKSSPYTRMAQNELALELFRYGLFDPAASEAALICLEMMDIDGKDALVRKVREAGERYRGGGSAVVTEAEVPVRTAISGEAKVTADARRAAAERLEAR